MKQRVQGLLGRGHSGLRRIARRGGRGCPRRGGCRRCIAAPIPGRQQMVQVSLCLQILHQERQMTGRDRRAWRLVLHCRQ
ncbi:hypothetical protein [Symbiopectobacterium purcellii]|uniref:hypothetical protein n=1 Tax=Symbiopectobacterium purcellii TaxID=2871826 RepID=UPI003F82A14E